MKKIEPMNSVETVKSFLESGVDIQTIKKAFIRGGLKLDEINFIIAYIGETEGNKLINLTNQYLNGLKEDLNSIVNLLSKAK